MRGIFSEEQRLGYPPSNLVLIETNSSAANLHVAARLSIRIELYTRLTSIPYHRETPLTEKEMPLRHVFPAHAGLWS